MLETSASPDTLNARANDVSLAARYRALAVFQLFATYVRPGQSAAEVHKVLQHANWLRTARVSSLGFGTGWSPVEFTPADSPFGMALFPDKDGQSDWRISLVLSGHPPPGSPPLEEPLKFFEGDPTLRGDATLKEFALCFVGGIPFYSARIERFSPAGLEVYDWLE